MSSTGKGSTLTGPYISGGLTSKCFGSSAVTLFSNAGLHFFRVSSEPEVTELIEIWRNRRMQATDHCRGMNRSTACYRLSFHHISSRFVSCITNSSYSNSLLPSEQWICKDSARGWVSSHKGFRNWQEVSRVLYGCNRGRVVTPVAPQDDDESKQDNFDLQVRLYLSKPPAQFAETRIGANSCTRFARGLNLRPIQSKCERPELSPSA